MSIVRDMGFVVQSLEDRVFITCSTANQWIGGDTGTQVKSSDAAAGTIYGRIFDRLGDLLGAARFTVAMPATHLYATRGSTEANRRVSLAVKLQHGDSSGGGDMADYSTGSQPADRNYFTTARTTEYANWDTTGSTGALKVSSAPAYYDLRAAKRFIRAAHIASKNGVTTESSGDEAGRLSGTIAFLGGDFAPIPADRSYSSTSTSTST